MKINIILILIIVLMTFCIYDLKQNQFTQKDWIILYELCNKKSWSHTNTILKSYWEVNTKFKEYLLK
jgi:hypothetical protein